MATLDIGVRPTDAINTFEACDDGDDGQTYTMTIDLDADPMDQAVYDAVMGLNICRGTTRDMRQLLMICAGCALKVQAALDA